MKAIATFGVLVLFIALTTASPMPAVEEQKELEPASKVEEMPLLTDDAEAMGENSKRSKRDYYWYSYWNNGPMPNYYRYYSAPRVETTYIVV